MDAGLATGLASEEKCPILSDTGENRTPLCQNKKKEKDPPEFIEFPPIYSQE